jgi:hypothetical protein
MYRQRHYNFEYFQLRIILQCNQGNVTVVRPVYPFPKMELFGWRKLRKLLRGRGGRNIRKVSNVEMCQMRGSPSRRSMFESFF